VEELKEDKKRIKELGKRKRKNEKN